MVALTSFPPPTEGIACQESNTQAHVGNKLLGNGTLFIAESRVSWRNDNGDGFSIEYPAIALHAVSRDLQAYPHECLYLMIDAQIDEPTNGTENDDIAEDQDDPLSEIRFIPQDKNKLDEMFRAMSSCQALHPDPNDSISEDEGVEDDDGGDDEGSDSCPNNGELMETDQFHDAEEM